MDRSAKVPWLAIILAGSFALRAVAAVAVQKVVDRTPGRLCLISGDADGYWQLGRKLARGDEYSVYEPPRRVLRVPGFPFLLSLGIRAFGERPFWIRLLLAAVGTIACGLTYRLAGLLFDHRTAVVAGIIAAVHPAFIGFSVLFLSETLFAVALLASLIALAHLVRAEGQGLTDASKVWWAFVSGLLIGVATLVRPTWLLIGPGFVALYVLLSARRIQAAVHGAVLMAGLALCLAPWTIRNATVTGHFIPTTLWVGASLYDGLNPQATGASDMRFVEDDGIYQQMSEYDADQFYRRKAIEFVRERPLRSLELAVIKLWRFWNPVPNAQQFGRWEIAAVVALGAIPLIGLAVWGGIVVRHNYWSWLIPAAPVLYFSLVHMVFVGSVRYRLPVEYPLAALAAVAVCRGIDVYRESSPTSRPSQSA